MEDTKEVGVVENVVLLSHPTTGDIYQCLSLFDVLNCVRVVTDTKKRRRLSLLQKTQKAEPCYITDQLVVMQSARTHQLHRQTARSSGVKQK
jgi:hypothetical protein